MTLRPSSGHVRYHETANEGTVYPRTAVGDEVGFHKTGLSFVPIGEGSYRNLFLEQLTGFGRRDSSGAGVPPVLAQQSVDSRGRNG